MKKKTQEVEETEINGKSVTLAKGKATLRLSTGQTRSGQLVVRATMTEADGKTKIKSREFVSDAKEQDALYADWQAKAAKAGFSPKGSPMVPFADLLS